MGRHFSIALADSFIDQLADLFHVAFVCLESRSIRHEPQLEGIADLRVWASCRTRADPRIYEAPNDADIRIFMLAVATKYVVVRSDLLREFIREVVLATVMLNFQNIDVDMTIRV